MNFFQRFYTFFSATYTALGKVAIREVMHVSQSVSKLVGVLLLFYIGFDLISLSYVYLFSSFIPLLFGYYFFGNINFGAFSLVKFKDYLYFTFPLFFSEGLSTLFQRLDKLIIAFFLNFTVLSIYVICMSLVNILKFLNKSLGITVFPKINSKLSSNKFSEVQELIEKTNRLLIIFTTFTLFGIILFTDNILLQIYGPEYEAGYELLVLLFIGFLFRLLSISSAWILLSREKQYLISKLDIFRIILISFSMVSLLHFKLIDAFIALGFSWILGEFIYLVLCFYYSQRDRIIEIKFGLSRLPILLLLLPSILLCIFVNYSPHANLTIEALLFAIFLVYWYLLTYLGIISKNEIIEILESLNLRKLINYAKSEFNNENAKTN